MVGAGHADPDRVRRVPRRLGNASGFQSAQYRAVEFMLGNKNADMLQVFDADAAAHAVLSRAAGGSRACTTSSCAFSPGAGLDDARRGAGARRATAVTSSRRRWCRCSSRSTTHADTGTGTLYEACEELVDLEDNFQLWRFRHLRTVQRTIGFKTGTGGSSGVGFLQKALELTFFPELYAVRTEIGK